MNYILDVRPITHKEALYDALVESLELPDYMGHNLDALWDVLSERSDPMTLLLVNARFLPHNLGDYGLGVLNLFGDLDLQTCHTVLLKW